MRRAWRILAVLVIAAPFLLYAALRLGLWTPFVNLALSTQLSPKIPLQIRVGSIRSDIGSFIEAEDVVVLAPRADIKLPLLTVAKLRLEYRGWAAWRGKVEWTEALTLARIRGLNVFLLRQQGGDWNMAGLGGMGKGAKEPAVSAPTILLPAARVELEDSQVVLNDEARGFQTSIENLQGSLDTRALPLLAFSLNGRTEGKSRDDLSLAGEWDQRDGSMRGRLDLSTVPLARYLNYLLPVKGLTFESGDASLSVRLRRSADGALDAAGRAELSRGALRIPGIAEPLTQLQGAIAFDAGALRFQGVQARFLDSEWTASGAIVDLAAPRFEVRLVNAAFPLQALSDQVTGMGQLALSGTATVDATLSGPATRPIVLAQLGVPALGIVGVEMLDVSATARLQGSQLAVQQLDGRLWGGQLQGQANMGLGRGGRLEASLDLKGAELGQALLKGRRPLPLSGTAELHLKAQGLLKEPQLDIDLHLANSSLGALQLGALQLDAEWSPKGLRSRFKGADGRLEGSINFGRTGGAQFEDSRIELRGLELAQLAQGLATAGDSMVLPPAGVRAGQWLQGRLAGVVRANLSFEGELRSPAIWIDASLDQGRLFLQEGPLQLRDRKAGLPLSLRGEIGFQQSDVRFGRQNRPLRLSVQRKGRDFELQALGRYPLRNSGQAGRLELAADGDLRILEAFNAFKSAQGRFKADLLLGGTLDSPQAQGELGISGFSAKPEAYLAPVRGGELKLRFQGQRIELSELRLRSGGLLSAKGSLDLTGGMRGMFGSLELRTDAEGLRLQNWEGMGSGNLVLDPVTLSVDGEGLPLRLEGQARLSNALIVYAGRAKGAASEAGSGTGRPMDVDLKVGLGANVWYEKRAEGVEIFDPTRWVSGTLASVQDTFQRPDVFFRLRPTERDLRILRKGGELSLSGTLAIDRGRLTVMENDFEIKDDLQGIESVGPRVSMSGGNGESGRAPSGASSAMVRFNGRRADVYATAVSRMRYTRNDRLTGRPQPRRVNVIVYVAPLDPEQLERAGLADSFLNYSIEFGADALIEKDIIPPHRQGEAILNMVVLGDPLLDLQLQAELAGGQDTNSKVLDSQINRLISGEFKRQLSKWSKRGFKFLGGQFFDVLRVVPRFSYQSANQNKTAPTGNQGLETSQQAQESALVFNDVTVELGTSLGESLYASLQYIRFGENGLSAAGSGGASASGLASQQVLRDYGVRTGIEYQFSPNRTAELYHSYSLDDNMQPLPFNPENLYSAHSYGVRLRNTIPTENYSATVARKRRWGQDFEVKP